MNSLAQSLAFSQPRGSGQSPISPLAMQLSQSPTTHWAELLGKLAMVGVDAWGRSKKNEEGADSIAAMLMPDASKQWGNVRTAAGMSGGGGQRRNQIAEMLASNPELMPFAQSAAMAQQFPELFGDPAAQGGMPEFKVIGNSAAWVNPLDQSVEWVLGGPPGGMSQATPAAGPSGPSAPTAPTAAPSPTAAALPSRPAAPPAAAQVPPEPTPSPSGQAPARPKPLNETQSKASEFSSYIARGGQNIDALIENGFRPSMMTMLMEPSQDFFGMIANQTLTPEEQQFWQAVNEITAGVLRRETGAAFGADEVRRVMSRVIPLPNDDDATLELKRETRNGIMNEMRRSAGLDPFDAGGSAEPASPAAPAAGNGNLIEPPVPANTYPEGATYEGPEGKFVVQGGQWWQVE